MNGRGSIELRVSTPEATMSRSLDFPIDGNPDYITATIEAYLRDSVVPSALDGLDALLSVTNPVRKRSDS